MHCSQLSLILPEVLLTVTGILVMLVESGLRDHVNRRFMGVIALLGTLAALGASIWQGMLPSATAFFGVVQLDAFSVFFHVVVCSILLITVLVSLDVTPGNAEQITGYYALLLFGAVGMCLMSSATELLLVFVSLEISSISTYILAGYRRHNGKSLESAIKYFLLGSFATAFFLYGIALSFGATGTTNIAGLTAGLFHSPAPRLAYVAVGMILIGLGFKVSAAPFHFWTPDVYEGAPSPVVGWMSTAPKAAAIAVLLRIVFSGYPQMRAEWSLLIWLLAAISMTVGNLGALRQQNVKRMLAYSSIAHGGYLLVAFTAFSTAGIAAAIFYTAAYAAMNVGLFAVVSYAGGYDDLLLTIGDYRGLARRSPVLGGAMAVFLLSLIGIPFTGGFFGKFYIFSAALHSGVIWLSVIGLINSGIASFYYLRLLISLYGTPSDDAPVQSTPRLRPALAVALLLALSATLIFGIFPNQVLSSARAAAATLGAGL